MSVEISSATDSARPGFHLIHKMPEGEAVLSIVVWQQRVVVATTLGVFVLIEANGPLQRLQFEVEDDD